MGSKLMRLGSLTVVSLALVFLTTCSGSRAEDATKTSTGSATSAHQLQGGNVPAALLGAYHDGGEKSVGWYFLPAGDDFCAHVVKTEQSCLKITRPGATVDYGPMAVNGKQLLIYLIYDEANECLHQEYRINYTTRKDGIDLDAGVCGAPRAPLIRGEPTS